jgi:hypothetical protein
VEQFWLWLVGFRSIRPADLACVCTPRFIANDTQAPLVQPAPEPTPHDKLTSKNLFATAWCAFATQGFICLSPTSHGSNVLKLPWVVDSFDARIIPRYSLSPLAG